MTTRNNFYENLATVTVWVVIIIGIIIMTNWVEVRAFFANTPMAKCEVRIESADEDSYCKTDGTKGSILADNKQKCLLKSPNFDWKYNDCVRIKYESVAQCEADGREGLKSTQDGEDFYVRCKTDGTWESYDPEYKDRQMDESIKESSITCHDATSYDYNWNNDMLCVNPDGSQFYTSYENAKQYEY